MAGYSAFSIATMPDSIGKNTIVERMRANQPLTEQEKAFAVMVFDYNIGSTAAMNRTPGVEDNLSVFDRLFINGKSVTSIFEQNKRTEGMHPQEKTDYMKAFLFTEAYARDNVIEYCPPGKENSSEPNPQIRLDTGISPKDAEEEKPKRGFWRTIGEALRILKPLPTPQELYEQRMDRDEQLQNDHERGSMIKNSVQIREGYARNSRDLNQAEANLQSSKELFREELDIYADLHPEIDQPKKEQKLVVLSPQQEYDNAKQQLDTMLDAKKLYDQTIMTAFKGVDESSTQKVDVTATVTRMEKQAGIKPSSPADEYAINETPDAVKSVPATEAVLQKIGRFWGLAATRDDAHPDGLALNMSANDAKQVTEAFNKDLSDLNKNVIKASAGLDMGAQK